MGERDQEIPTRFPLFFYLKKIIVNNQTLTVILVFTGILFFIGLLAGCPQYNVWQQGLKGEAELKRAQQNRKIIVEQAIAKNEAADHLNEREIKNARATATANAIIDSSLTDQYIRYLYIDHIQDIGCKAIYIPTEAGIPILEVKQE